MEFVEEVANALPEALELCRSAGLEGPSRAIRVSAGRLALLELLDPTEGASVGTLARRAGVTPATMSAAVSRLVRDGCALRTRSDDDARVVEVRLTPEGEALRRAIAPFDPHRIEALAEHLTSLEQREVLHGLRLLCQAAAKSRG